MKRISTLMVALAFVAFPTVTSAFSEPLKLGSSGTPVFQLQDFLKYVGCMSVEPTAYFGFVTLDAVKCFQSKTGLPSTGYFGPLTMAMANSIASQTTASSTQAEIEESEKGDGVTVIDASGCSANGSQRANIRTYERWLTGTVTVSSPKTKDKEAVFATYDIRENVNPYIELPDKIGSYDVKVKLNRSQREVNRGKSEVLATFDGKVSVTEECND